MEETEKKCKLCSYYNHVPCGCPHGYCYNVGGYRDGNDEPCDDYDP